MGIFNWLTGADVKETTYLYARHVIRLMISAAKVDGEFNDEERKALVREFGFAKWVAPYCEEVHHSIDGVRCLAESGEFVAAHIHGPTSRFCILRGALLVMSADGIMNQAEIDWMTGCAQIIQMPRRELLDVASFFFVREVYTTEARVQVTALLALHPDADDETIKLAYRRKAASLHPDVLGDVNQTVKDLAEDKLKEINNAYDNLTKREAERDDPSWLRHIDDNGHIRQCASANSGDVTVCICCEHANRLPARSQMCVARCTSCRSYLCYTDDQIQLIITFHPFYGPKKKQPSARWSLREILRATVGD